MIYVIKAGEFYKIGYTSGRKLEPRMSSMQTSNPYTLEAIGLWRGTESDEAALHAYYAHRRVRGEWFALTVDDVERIREIMEAKPVDVELPPPPRANPPDPKCLPELTFPSGLNVEVKDAGCTWCGRWLHFVGEINYLVCEPCNRKVPMGNVICSPYRREAVERVMREHACS